jgi:CO/xanthine dehydrogenase FAD-binding subunit
VFVKPFRYDRADSFADASAMLREAGGSAKVLAGGQSLLPMLNLGILDVESVIDVAHVEGARGISREDGFLVLGALTTHRDLERDATVASGQPLLAAAAGWIGSSRIRARGTIGGSLAHADPAAELPLATVVTGAEYELTDGVRTRTIKATDFHEGSFTTALAEDELLERVRVPVLGPGWGWGFAEISRRRGDFATVAAAALARVADGAIVESRLGLAGVGDRAMRMGAVEIAVEGANATGVGDRVAPLDDLDAVTDISATGEDRRRLARVLAVRALTDAAVRASEAAA